jgi:hypothetical protein
MKAVGVVALSALVMGCVSTPYQSSGFTGGLTELQLKEDIWRVRFSGNGFTTPETAQTYWLYRCAELALERGYEGFQVLSDIRFVELPLDGVNAASEGRFLRTAAPVYIPMYIDQSRHPRIEGDIRLLRKPFNPIPPKVFDAGMLKGTLDRYVKGEKCSGDGGTTGNVCPHVHDYLFPTAPAARPASS